MFFCRVVAAFWFALLPVSASAQDASPLPPCPSTPNCERVSRAFAVDPDTLFQAAQRALASLGPAALDVKPEAHRIHAVYRVALLFNDDVDVAVTPADDRSWLHIRSASRVGVSDLGVNKRRVQRFFSALSDEV
jgi:uncharacterized protein (DUF1499 family)